MTGVPCGRGCLLHALAAGTGEALSRSSRGDLARRVGDEVYRSVPAGDHPAGHPFSLSAQETTRAARADLLRRLRDAPVTRVQPVLDVCDCTLRASWVQGRPVWDLGLGPDGNRLVPPATRNSPWDLHALRSVLADLADGLAALHELGIAHGDPALMNCLIDTAGSGVWVDLASVREATPEAVAVDVRGFILLTALPALLCAEEHSPTLLRDLVTSASDGLGAVAAQLRRSRDDVAAASARTALGQFAHNGDAVDQPMARMALATAPAYFLDLAEMDLATRFYEAVLRAERQRQVLLEEERTRVLYRRWADQVESAVAHQQGLARELSLAQESIGRLQSEHDEVRAQMLQARRAEAEAHEAADELWAQLQAVLGSTAWRVTAPLRALGTAKRRTRQAAPLLAEVNRRKLAVAGRLAARGDWVTLRQRVRAANAVSQASLGAAPQSPRPVQHREPEPWPPDVPLVTVVVPCFDYGAFVDEAIDSVLSQTVAHRLELVVVDGGSGDPATVARLTELEAAPPPRTQVIVRRDGRHLVGDNRNLGISRGRGRYVCALDADDLLEPVYLEVALYLLERWGYDVVSTATQCFDLSDERFGLLPRPTLEDMLLANNVTTVAVYRKSLWERAGGYHDEGLGGDYVYEDWKLWVRLAALGARIHNIVGQPLFRYRVHSPASLSRQSGSVAEMARHRASVRDHNSDVVSPEAIESSRRAAAIEVGVRDGWRNLVPAERDRRPTVLLAMPFLCVGGAERLLSDVTGHLARSGFRIVITTDVHTDPSYGDTTDWFADATREVYHLHRLLEPHQWGDYVHYLVEAKSVDVVLVAGSAHTYSLLPGLRQRFPHLRVADLLFNTVGHVASNRRYADHIDLHLCEQADVEQWLLGAGQAADTVIRVASGIDTTRYRPVPHDARDRLRVGFSGRLSEEKDPMGFLDIAAATGDDRLEFIMTGAGPLEKQVRRRLSGTPSAARFLGVVDDVQAHVADLDVLVLPSRLDGRPMVVLEALALGVPVLASRVGGLPELVEDGVNGLLCAPGDTDGFAAALRRVAEDPTLLAHLKTGARRSAEERLDARAMYAAYESALRRLIPARE